MKKVFQLMGIAVLACGMFTSCFGDDDEVKDGIKVTMDDSSWDATTVYGLDWSALNAVYLDAYKDENSASKPSVNGFVPSAPGNVTFSPTKDEEEISYLFWYMENDNDYFNGDEGNPNWQPQNFTENITAIDLTAMTLSGEGTGSMYNQKTEKTAVLSINFNNATWVTPSDKSMKKMAKIAK